MLGSNRFFDSYFGNYKIISETPRRLLKTQNFEKKGTTSSEEKILAYVFSYYRYEKGQGAFHKASEGKLTNIVQAIRSFL